MADPFAIEKVAIDELDPLPSGLDPNQVYVPVFRRATSVYPLKTTLAELGGGGTTEHKEADTFEISSTSISVTFDSAFLQTPVNTESIQVYKYVDGYRYNYLIDDLAVITTGFTGTVLDVDPDVTITDFTGIILEYCLFERNT